MAPRGAFADDDRDRHDDRDDQRRSDERLDRGRDDHRRRSSARRSRSRSHSPSQPRRRNRDDRSRSRSPRRSVSPPRRYSRGDRSRSPPRRSPRNEKPWEDCMLFFYDHYNTLLDGALRKSCVVPYTADAAEVTAGVVVAKGYSPTLLSYVKKGLSIGDKTPIRMLFSIGMEEPETLLYDNSKVIKVDDGTEMFSLNLWLRKNAKKLKEADDVVLVRVVAKPGARSGIAKKRSSQPPRPREVALKSIKSSLFAPLPPGATIPPSATGTWNLGCDAAYTESNSAQAELLDWQSTRMPAGHIKACLPWPRAFA